ncbi:Retrovirus-related Pol polyprotein from transposon TNT 1-94 [Senna tora]|uniref:Retrovirus-related Pol polyprotein from transposon TNT 1-94 n=1 Tax=Senna tora TaxID=362788 RepID=A0A834WZS8_9FABA|nr:Retrovirus-related Pol polyprotein from transposon TNT 1-94 [Senna tora]
MSTPASVFQQLSTVKTLNGTNYDDCYESLEMYLIVSNEDLAIREPRPAVPTNRASDADKTHYQLWHESNRVCLSVLKFTIDKTIRQSIPEKETATEYLKAISEKFKKFEKSQKAYYLSLLDNTQYDGVSGVREHMMKLINYFNKLKSLKLDLGESYLVYKILQSLPADYGVLRTTYNSQEAEWTINQMMSIVTQEEESLKKVKSLSNSINQLSLDSSQKGGNEKPKGKRRDNKKSGKPKRDYGKDKSKMKKTSEGSSAAMECVGTVVLNLYSGHELILHDVVYVPSSRRSLVSTSVLDRQDDYSRFGWIYLLHEKSDSLYAFKAFKAAVELKSDSGSNTPRVINLRNENTTLPLSSQTCTSVARIPPLVHDYRDDILIENPIDPINVPPTDEVEEPGIEPIANVRRSQRSRKDAIPDDYIVYLQEFESDVVDGVDPTSYKEAISSAVSFSHNHRNSKRTKHFDVKFLFVRENIAESQTCLIHIPGEHMLADPLTKGLLVRVFKNHVTHMGVIPNFDEALV